MKTVLEDNEIHLWHVALQDTDWAELHAKFGHILSAAEREKVKTFVPASKKTEYLVTRLLVRSVLSRYGTATPEAWVFGETEFGRPVVVSPALQPGLTFSVSHCKGLVVCAVARDCELGVDAEKREGFPDLRATAETVFSMAELEQLRQLSGENSVRKFYELWTLKEAYLKARGLGFSLASREFSVFADKNGAFRLDARAAIDSRPGSWVFKTLTPTPEHQLALAIRDEGSTPRVIVEYWHGFGG